MEKMNGKSIKIHQQKRISYSIITIVEGIFDAFVATNAIPLLGSTLRENSYILNRISAKCDKVYIALDDDAFLKEEKICRLLREYDVEPLKVDISGKKSSR
jgi:hypothetical protein